MARRPSGAATATTEGAAVAVLNALADPTRRQLLDHLSRHGPATVADLTRQLPITRQAVAKQLVLVADAGLVVAGQPQGRRVPFRICPAPARATLEWLAALAYQWEERLDTQWAPDGID